MATLHGGGIGRKCRLAKVTIAGGLGSADKCGYGAYRHSVFLAVESALLTLTRVGAAPSTRRLFRVVNRCSFAIGSRE